MGYQRQEEAEEDEAEEELSCAPKATRGATAGAAEVVMCPEGRHVPAPRAPNKSTSFADTVAAEKEEVVAAAARAESSAPPLSSRRPAATKSSRRTSRCGSKSKCNHLLSRVLHSRFKNSVPSRAERVELNTRPPTSPRTAVVEQRSNFGARGRRFARTAVLSHRPTSW